MISNDHDDDDDVDKYGGSGWVLQGQLQFKHWTTNQPMILIFMIASKLSTGRQPN